MPYKKCISCIQWDNGESPPSHVNDTHKETFIILLPEAKFRDVCLCTVQYSTWYKGILISTFEKGGRVSWLLIMTKSVWDCYRTMFSNALNWSNCLISEEFHQRFHPRTIIRARYLLFSDADPVYGQMRIRFLAKCRSHFWPNSDPGLSTANEGRRPKSGLIIWI